MKEIESDKMLSMPLCVSYADGQHRLLYAHISNGSININVNFNMDVWPEFTFEQINASFRFKIGIASFEYRVSASLNKCLPNEKSDEIKLIDYSDYFNDENSLPPKQKRNLYES